MVTVTSQKLERRSVPSTAGWGRRQPEPFWANSLRHCMWCAVVAILCVAVVEGVFALAHIGEQQFVELEPKVGTLHIRNKFLTWRSEGYSQSTTNSAGFRDQERQIAKPDNVKRIAFLGDSMTEAMQVDPSQTFAGVLQKQLNEQGEKNGSQNKIEVLNFGMSGYSTVQEVYLFKHRVLDYKPDVCILAYHVGDNEKNVDTTSGKSDRPRPYVVYGKDGTLQTDWAVYNNSLQSTNLEFFRRTEFLRKNSRIWDVLSRADMEMLSQKWFDGVRGGFFKIVGSFMKPQIAKLPLQPAITVTAKDLLGDDADPSSFTKLESIYPDVAPYNPLIRPGSTPAQVAAARESIYYVYNWRALRQTSRHRFGATSQLIESLNSMCKANNCKLVLLALHAPYNSQLYFKELQALQKLSQKDGFAMIDTNQKLPAWIPGEKSPLYYGIHFTPLGHKLVADQLAEELRKQGVI